MTKNTSRSRRLAAVVGATALGLALAGCGQGFSSGDETSSGDAGGGLNVLVATGDQDSLKALQDLGDAWTEKSGVSVDVQPASDMNQQLSQGFAAGNPPDVFWVDASLLPTYASAGNLWAYGDQMSDIDFYPALIDSFTYDGQLYCAPKDFSNLGLVINTDMWAAAGLTDADIPTTWEQLESVAQKLTTDSVKGLVIGDTRDRVGAFMKQAGGWITNADQTEMTIDSPEAIAGIAEVQKLLESGAAAFPKQVDSGWGGEAIGTGKAAMTIEGNWFKSAAGADYPDLKWRVAELPAGPAGKGTLTFTQCWAIADASKNKDAALEFVKSMYTPEIQVDLANRFGVMPSIESAREQYIATVPEAEQAWLAGADYAQGPVSAVGMDPVMKDLDTLIQQLPGISPEEIAQQTQANGEAVLGG
ncbi:sugar ABC transporter substrate-binding protein [Microbacterium paraoxydans]|uniref:sugar ABC transporter substrate-binding protein n=1 Tax=Microbacterium paraoxydans TaxID=199592 RepID=UPI0030133B7F